MAKTKNITCTVCFREMTVTQAGGAGSNYFGTCPYCRTYDNGTGYGKLTIEAEYAACRELGHDWGAPTRTEVHGQKMQKRKCKRCGHVQVSVLDPDDVLDLPRG